MHRRPASSRWVAAAAASLTLLVLAGCGTTRYLATEAPSQSLSSFGTVEVKKFTAADQVFAKVEADDQKAAARTPARISDLLEESLAEKKFFTSGTGRKLVVEGQVVLFDPGSRAARYIVGFGAGAGKIVVAVMLRDEEGNTVAKYTAEGGISMGAFGGSWDESIPRVVEAIVGFVEANYRRMVAPK